MMLADTLATWLPAQRWYSGAGGPIRDLAIKSDVTLVAGDPELRHLVVTLYDAGEAARYQVLIGIRTQMPDSLRHAIIGPADPGRTGYDALHDAALARVLLRGIAQQRATGPLRFVAAPDAVIDTGPDGLVIGGEQSNTSLTFGDVAILKVLRRLFPGSNPELEVTRALARRGSEHVAEPFGWIETEMDGEPFLLAILSRYLPGASDGWSLALTSLRDLYAGDTTLPGRRLRPAQAGGDFAGEAYRLGAATAEVHADMAAEFGTEDLPAAALGEMAGQMTARLDRACAEVPELRRHAAKLRGYYAVLTRLRGPLQVQRVHGDYHLGQVLRTATGWVALDFEGEPAAPLGDRRARSPALRDVAGMLRSFDYAARHQLVDRPDEKELRNTAGEWVRRSQDAFCHGYADGGGTDPWSNAELLRALKLDKAVYEVVYEARHRPSWLPIPLDSIANAL